MIKERGVLGVSDICGTNIIFMLTEGGTMASTGGSGVFEGQVNDAVIEFTNSRLGFQFRQGVDMTGSASNLVDKCPLGLVCYSSCLWWKNGQCSFPQKD